MAAGEELLDPGQDLVGLVEPGEVVGALDLKQPRARDVIGEVPAVLHRNGGVLAGMDDQGGRGDRRQDRPPLSHSQLAHRPDRRRGDAGCRTAAPVGLDRAGHFLPAGEVLRGRGVILTQLGYEARPQLGRVAVHVIPPREAPIWDGVDEDQCPRSLRSCCREHHGGCSAVTQTGDDGLSEADGVHDGLDLGRSIIERANFRDRIRQADPGLVE